ncbi:MAG TPA: DinB family protein [Bryobacteraceae bacterium]|jgi:uncharacterized damage-inducible protein DinB|nr:DinB family protein [Bryobacteraceae bacterium]
MRYSYQAIGEEQIPQAVEAAFQHVVDTYASETNKLISVWRCFSDADFAFRPHPKSSTVEEIIRHELLSGRRFFGEFLSGSEPGGKDVVPSTMSIEACSERMRMLARRRLDFLASRAEEWWLEEQPFFDVTRQRIWIFWRRVLHTAHHRTQLTVYLRLLGRDVPPIYGPTADVAWTGADPTHTAEASERS